MTRQELEKAFWDLWYEDQSEKEQGKRWLPSKRPHQIPEEFLMPLDLQWAC